MMTKSVCSWQLAHPSIIDLAESDLHVMAPLETPSRHEVRLEEALIEKVLWEGDAPL